MTAGLFHHPVPGINGNDDQVGIGCSRNHVPGVLNMSRRVGDDEFAFGRGEVFISYVNGDPLFTFGAQSVRDQSKINISLLFVFTLFFV